MTHNLSNKPSQPYATHSITQRTNKNKNNSNNNLSTEMRNSNKSSSSSQPKGVPCMLEIIRMQTKSPILNVKTDGKCANCSRGLLVEGTSTIRQDGDYLFCGINCMWSARLDPTGSRHKVARRVKAGKKDKRRHVRREPHITQDEVVETKTCKPNKLETFGDCSNAMFEYHMMNSNNFVEPGVKNSTNN